VKRGMFKAHALARGLLMLAILFPGEGLSRALPPVWLWTTEYDSGGFDACNGIASDSSGNVYAVGFFTKPSLASLVLNKFSPDGGLVWTVTFSGVATVDDNTSGWAIALDGAGNAYVTGNRIPPSSSNQDLLVAKISPEGALVWSVSYDGGRCENGRGVCLDGAGNIYAAVDSTLPTGSSYVSLLCKYDPAGTRVWSLTLGGVQLAQGKAVDSDGAGNIYVLDTVHNGMNWDYRVSKVTPDGTKLWSKSYDDGGNEYGYRVVTGDDGYLYVNAGWRLNKFTASGDLLWSDSRCGSSEIALGANGDIYTGGSYWNGAGFDTCLCEYTPAGGLLWSLTVAGGLSYGLAIAGEDAIYVPSDYGSNYSLMKYKLRQTPAAAGLTAIGQGAGINLSWSLASGTYAVSCFHVYRSAGPGLTPSYLSTVRGAGASAFNDEDVTSGAVYCYAVKPVDVETNEGDLSNEACASLSLAPPSNLSAIAGCGIVLLSWQKSVSSVVTGCRVYRSSFPGLAGKSLLISLGASASVYRDTGVSEGRLYCYHVIAVSGIYESAPTDELAVRTPACELPLPLPTLPLPPYTGPLRVYPNPFNPKTAVRGTVKFEGLPVGSQVRLYTPAGLKVWEGKVTVPNVVEWNGKTESGRPVSPGVYPWVAEGGGRKDRGTLIVE